MALPLSGHKDYEVLLIETNEFILSIKGRPLHPIVDKLSLHRNSQGAWEKAELNIISHGIDYQAWIFDPFQEGNHLKPYLVGAGVFPCFYENQAYQLVIESKNGEKLRFYHENKRLREAITYLGRSERILSGNINFQNDIGKCEFQIWQENKKLLTVCLEVFPSKIEYRRDYIQLLTEVNAELYNLAFDFLRKTYLSASVTPSVKSSPTEFFSIITYCFDKLCQAVERLCRTPHHVVKSHNQISTPDKVKRVNNNTLKWLSKNLSQLNKSNEGVIIGGEKYLPQKILETKKEINFDTFENRFIKWVLNSIGKKLKHFHHLYNKNLGSSDAFDNDIVQKIKSMENKLARFQRLSFLNKVGKVHKVDNLSLVLQMAPGYREVYKYYLMLLKGLTLQSDIFKISIKDIALLYEYWCFIKMNSLLKSKYHLDKHDLIKVNHQGIILRLDKSMRSSLHYTNPRNGEKIILSYNNLLNKKMATTNQRPDNMLSLRKEGSDIEYQYVFDVKYRLNPALSESDYDKKYGKPGPQEDDINTMHRYRDAIMTWNKDQITKSVFGAFILFPLKDGDNYAGIDDGKPHTFYTSIDQVNIGGLPFLPGETKLVENFLEELIIDSCDTAFEGSVSQKGTEEYYQEKFQKRNVLVGTLGSREQLCVSLKQNFYHIPYNLVKKTCFNITHVAIFQSGLKFKEESGIRYYGKVTGMEVVKRKEIKEIPKQSEELYVKFQIKEWQELKVPIKPMGYGVRTHVYTTLILLENAKELPELSLRSEEEFRLWKELRRISREINWSMGNKELTVEDGMKEILLGNVVIVINGEQLIISNGDEQVTISVRMFKTQPKSVLKIIMRLIRNY